MNRYGKKVGYHSPILTELVLEKINKESTRFFEDSSWHNDNGDSLHCELESEPHRYIEVYLPSKEEHEGFFFVTNEDRDELLISENINEVIVFLNEEFDRPIETGNIETDRCPCCGSDKIKEYEK